jgi:hypothetical protein
MVECGEIRVGIDVLLRVLGIVEWTLCWTDFESDWCRFIMTGTIGNENEMSCFRSALNQCKARVLVVMIPFRAEAICVALLGIFAGNL